jgi:hypothetical protein
VDRLSRGSPQRLVMHEPSADAAGYWWRQLSADRLQRAIARSGSYDVYRLGRGILEVGGSEPALLDYIRHLYGDCRLMKRVEERLPTVRCTVSPTEHESVARVDFEDPYALDSFDFTTAVYGDRGYRACGTTASGWRCLTPSEAPGFPTVAMRGSTAMLDRRTHWQPLMAHLAINKLIQAQREMMFFHAATLSIGGAGVMLLGDKCAGKTTTAMFLAVRGHGLLSDEIGAVDSCNNQLVPFRRALSIRPGPLPEMVRARLQSGESRPETLFDGTTRIRARIGSIFGQDEPPPTRLQSLIFLNGFAGTPQAQRVSPRAAHVALLKPFGSSVYGASRRSVVFRLASILSRTRVYSLTLGSPDATAALIEDIVENS